MYQKSNYKNLQEIKNVLNEMLIKIRDRINRSFNILKQLFNNNKFLI